MTISMLYQPRKKSMRFRTPKADVSFRILRTISKASQDRNFAPCSTQVAISKRWSQTQSSLAGAVTIATCFSTFSRKKASQHHTSNYLLTHLLIEVDTFSTADLLSS